MDYVQRKDLMKVVKLIPELTKAVVININTLMHEQDTQEIFD